MALSKSFSFDAQVQYKGEFWEAERVQETYSADDVYIKVESVIGDKSIARAKVSFSAANEFHGTKEYLFTPDMEGPNYIKQAYLHLKTLPEFEGAVDC